MNTREELEDFVFIYESIGIILFLEFISFFNDIIFFIRFGSEVGL